MYESFTVEDITYTGGKKQTDGWSDDVEIVGAKEKVAPTGNLTIEKLIRFYEDHKNDPELGKVYQATLYYLTNKRG